MDFFLSFLAAIVGVVENGREEMHFGIAVEEERERDWKRWRRGETICRMELCEEAMVNVLWLQIWEEGVEETEVKEVEASQGLRNFLIELCPRERCLLATVAKSKLETAQLNIGTPAPALLNRIARATASNIRLRVQSN
jgi:hypothetical protein